MKYEESLLFRVRSMSISKNSKLQPQKIKIESTRNDKPKK